MKQFIVLEVNPGKRSMAELAQIAAGRLSQIDGVGEVEGFVASPGLAEHIEAEQPPRPEYLRVPSREERIAAKAAGS